MYSFIQLQHPDITRLEREGVPADKIVCHDCGDNFGPNPAYEVEGQLICESCFIAWVMDYLSTNPEDVAAALDVPVKKFW